jgi:hypothetical protein
MTSHYNYSKSPNNLLQLSNEEIETLYKKYTESILGKIMHGYIIHEARTLEDLQNQYFVRDQVAKFANYQYLKEQEAKELKQQKNKEVCINCKCILFLK